MNCQQSVFTQNGEHHHTTCFPCRFLQFSREKKMNLKIIIGEHNLSWEKQYKSSNSFPDLHIDLCLKFRVFIRYFRQDSQLQATAKDN